MSLYSRRSAWISAGVCLLFAGLTAGCEKGVPGNETGTVEAALVPPPPVNQNIGIYDRTFTGFAAGDCLKCHDGTGGTTCPDPSTNCQGVSLRHHMMLDPSSPRYKPQHNCTSCHTADGSGNMTVTFNCVQCHTSTPHHKSAPAAARHCNACHGSVINNFDDGHYVPTYAKSIVTPTPNCRVWTDASHTTCAAGGCQACHVASTAITPNTASNAMTHHGTGLGQAPNPPEQCGWCHSINSSSGGDPASAVDIRTCETCHGPTSLHAIEFEYDKNKGTPGYGHIGADQDCWGCHGFFDKYTLPPSFGPTVPTIDSVQPSAVYAGSPTEIVVSGQSLTNCVTRPDGTMCYDPVVVLSLLDNTGAPVATQAITPTHFTSSEVRVTVPATLRNGIWDVRVLKDYQGAMQVQSNNLPQIVRTSVAIRSAELSVVNQATTLTVTGSGFGPQPPSGIPLLGMSVGEVACQVSSWSNTQIVATCSAAALGAQVSVTGLFNAFSPAQAVISRSDFLAVPIAVARMTQTHDQQEPDAQMPELWNLYGGRASEDMQVIAQSNATELDRWRSSERKQMAVTCGPSCTTYTAKIGRITFDASGSSAVPPATIHSYNWVVTDAAGRVIASATAPSLDATFSKAGAYRSTLVITDSAGQVSSPAVTAITVR